ncbi:MAG: transketolase [Oscillospiraceae bacterium]|nr:transketolase [Oscillospiraceae bacterium]
MSKEINNLKRTAVQIRKDIMDISAHCGGGATHVGPALSAADIVAALYFKIMNVDPTNPSWEDRDRFILSKGHAYSVLYAALAERGYFPREELMTTRNINSRLQGHPVLGKTPGVDMVSGSLGNGLSCGLGIAMGLKLQGKRKPRVYVMLGDGESQEGMVWEAAMCAPNKGIDNLVAIVDYNHLQSCGALDEINSLHPMVEKWESFGWKVFEMNGHDMDDIVSKLLIAREYAGQPVCLIAHTVKGRGVSFIEHNNAWHAKIATEAEYQAAIEELDAQLTAIDADED